MNRFGGRGNWNWRTVAVVAVLATASAVGVWWLARQAVAVHRLTRGVGDTMFYGANGAAWFRLDEQRHDVPLSAISLDLQHAIVAVEDQRFYSHPGVDPIGIARALVRDIRTGERVEGGSTLTQQLARTLFLSNVRTFGRKAKEAAIALVRAPSALSPWSNYEGALERSRLVLTRMRAQGFITPEQQASAERVRPPVQPYRSVRDTRAAWAKEYLRQQFRNEFGGDHPPDWKVYTTFHPSIQDGRNARSPQASSG